MYARGVVTSAYESIVEQVANSRPPVENLDEKLFPCGGPKAKTLVEISGRSNSGKTLMLSHIMARCLPPTYFGGKYSDVLFINMGHKFSIQRFRDYIKRFIHESREKCPTEECEEVLESCMESVTVLNCFSANEFDLSFDVAEDILLKNRYINMIAIDDIDAFYWQDVHQRLVRMRTHYEKTTLRLRKLCENHNVCCAYTLDSDYIKCRGKNQNPTKHFTKPEYTLKLKFLDDGTRTLNKSKITINHNGINI